MLNLLDQQTQAAVSGTKVRMLAGRPVSDNMIYRNVFTHVYLTITNASGGALAATVGDAINFATCLFGAFRLEFGDSANKEVVDSDVPFAQMRALKTICTGQDHFVLNNVTGKWIEMASVATSTAITGSIANTASTTIEFEVVRSFEIDRLLGKRLAFCPGATQMRSLYIELTRGPTFDPNSNWTQNGLASFRFMADSKDAPANASDPWARVVRGYRSTDKGLNLAFAPRGLLLSLQDFSYAQASTPLTTFSLRRDKDVPLFESITYKDMQAALGRETEVISDTWDMTGTATMLYRTATPTEIDGIPSGGFVLTQPANDLTAPDLWAVVIPEFDGGSLQRAGATATAQDGASSTIVSLQSTPASLSYGASTQAAMPVQLARPTDAHGNSDPTFYTRPGLVAQKGAGTKPYIPPATVAAAQKIASSGNAAAHDQTVTALARQVPGSVSVTRTASVPAKEALAAAHRIVKK